VIPKSELVVLDVTLVQVAPVVDVLMEPLEPTDTNLPEENSTAWSVEVVVASVHVTPSKE
jgi:hypothetical protein